MAIPKALSSYLGRIEATGAVRKRAADLAGLYEALGVTADDYFISEYASEDAARVHESLWLFTATHAMEARFAIEAGEQIDFVPTSNAIRHLIIETRDYRLEATGPKARMKVEIWLDFERVAELRATAENCEELKAIVIKHLLPNVLARP